jgi:hypothetical protein
VWLKLYEEKVVGEVREVGGRAITQGLEVTRGTFLLDMVEPGEITVQSTRAAVWRTNCRGCVGGDRDICV